MTDPEAAEQDDGIVFADLEVAPQPKRPLLESSDSDEEEKKEDDEIDVDNNCL